MRTGDLIQVSSGTSTKHVIIDTIARERVTVRWAEAGYVVDLQTGRLLGQILPTCGVHKVDRVTARVLGTLSQVACADLARLDALEVGEEIRIESFVATAGDRPLVIKAQVVDVLDSEGSLVVYVEPQGSLTEPVRSRWSVSQRVLTELRAVSGSVMAQAS